MAEIRQGFMVHPPRGRSERIRPSMADFALFSVLLALMASFLLLASFVRPGSLVWAWTIVIFASFYTRIPFIYIHAVRLSFYERMAIGAITTIAWSSFRFLIDREEVFTVALSYILISPELTGYTIRALQLAVGLSLFLTSTALIRPSPPHYDPSSHREPSTTQALPPVHPHLTRDPLPVPIRPSPLPRPSPPPARLVLCHTELSRPRCSYADHYISDMRSVGPADRHVFYVQPPHVTSRRSRVGYWRI